MNCAALKECNVFLALPNKRHQKRARWALDSQQVARVCGGRYAVMETQNEI
jgi:hypothetical protein